MTSSTKQMLDMMASNPKLNATDAYLKTHKTNHKPTAWTESSRILSNPESQLYLDKHRDLAKETKVRILHKAKQKEDDLKWQNLANTVSEQVLDRTEGKPVQRSVSKNEHLISISLGSQSPSKPL